MMADHARTKLDARNCTLVVVDVQNDYCHPEGTLGRTGADISGVDVVVSRIQQTIDAARAPSVPVVWVRTSRDQRHDSDAWRARHSLLLNPPQHDVEDAYCVTGTWGAEYYRLRPETNDVVVEKSRHSGFVGTDLEIILRTLARPSLIVAGVATNVCVESTVRDALYHEFHVSVIRDCCWSPSQAAHDASISNVGLHLGLVVTSEQLLRAWRGE